MLTRFFAVLIAIVGISSLAHAQDAAIDQSLKPQVEVRLEQVIGLFYGGENYEDIFGEPFREAVSKSQFDALGEQLTAQFGPVLRVENVSMTAGSVASFEIHFAKAVGTGTIALNPAPPHRIDGLLFKNFKPRDDSPTQVSESISALPGQANALLGKLGPDGTLSPILAHNADQSLALGSTFKLYVLSALARSISEGQHRWDEVVPLAAKSMPSGVLQNWPDGSQLTVQTLATLMISISDNTATDQLIDLLGREAVEQEVAAAGNAAPELNRPFLKTSDMFALKTGDPALLAAWRAADEQGRRAILAGLDPTKLDLSRVNQALSGNPVALDVEWFASPDDTARLFARLLSWRDPKVLEVLSINPALSQEERAKWAYVGYKGGSETGVLNLSWLLRAEDGQYYVATLGWNDPEKPIDQTRLELLAMRLIALTR